MDLICLIFSLFISPSCLTAFIILFSLGYEILCIPFLVAAGLSLSVGFLVFRYVMIIMIRRMTPRHYNLSRKIAHEYYKGKTLFTFTENEKWISNELNSEVTFNLKGIIFKKSFIVAYVVRALRYRKISNRLPSYKIGNYYFRIEDSVANSYLEFIYKNKMKRILIVKKGVSRYNFVGWLMMKSVAPARFQTKYDLNGDGRVIGKYNEEVFCFWYKRVKDLKKDYEKKAQ